MKKYIALFISLLFIFALISCDGNSEPELIRPVAFYYRIPATNEQSFKSSISYENRERKDYYWEKDILNLYLAGPTHKSLVSPFPEGTEVLYYAVEGSRVYIRISKHMNALTNLDYSIACACLALTALELSHAKLVELNIEGDDHTIVNTVVLPRISIMLEDDYIQEPEE